MRRNKRKRGDPPRLAGVLLLLAAAVLLALPGCQNPLGGAGGKANAVEVVEETIPEIPRVLNWTFQTVDEGDKVGAFNSLAVDPRSGIAHIGYFDLGNGSLKFSGGTIGAWTTVTLDPQPVSGAFTSTALDAAGDTWISYWSYPLEPGGPFRLQVGRISQGGWRTETVDLARVGLFTSLAMDPAGNPVVAYWKHYQDGIPASALESAGGSVTLPDATAAGCWELKLARRTGGGWRIETVDAGLLGLFPSLGIIQAADGYPVVSYWVATCGVDHQALEPHGPECWQLRLASSKGDRWEHRILDSGLGLFSSLALNAWGHPYVSYWKCEVNASPAVTALLDALQQAMTGEREAVENLLHLLQPGTEGGISDVYIELTGNLHLVRCWPGDYLVRTVVSGGLGVGLLPSIAVYGDKTGGDEYIGISYFDATFGDLKYVEWCNNGSSVTWVVDAEGWGVGAGSSVAFGPGGFPAISYFDLQSGHLKYAASWSPLVPPLPPI